MDKKPKTTNDTHSTPPPSPKSGRPSHSQSVPPTISWITERDILREFGDRRTRAVLAILTARRSSGCPEFFVPPHIAALFYLTPKDLSWALQDLEGKLVNTRSSIKGKFRKVCLLPEWENRVVVERKLTPTKADLLAQRGHGAEPSITKDPEVDATLKDLARLQSCERHPGHI